MAKNNKSFESQFNEFESKVKKLAECGRYAPVASFSGGEGKILNTIHETETKFEDAIRIGKGAAFCRFRTSVIVPDCGSKDLGYIKWGDDNLLPVAIEKLADALPYTAAGLEYISNLLAGNGLAFTYKYSKMVNGEPKETSIPYELAGTMLVNRIRELREKINEAKQVPISVNTQDENASNTLHTIEDTQYRKKAEPIEDPSAKYANKNYDDLGTDEQLLQTAIEDYRKWEETMDWIKEFCNNSGSLDDLIQQWANDNVLYNISFFRLHLEQGTTGNWGKVENVSGVKKLISRPRIMGISYQPTQCSRLEQMDDNLHINYVYYAERWRFEGTIKDTARAVVAHPCAEPSSRFRDLANIVINNQTTKPSSRPCITTPIYVGKNKSPYYPIQSWWSIFPTMIYNLAVTLMTDAATSRRNSTMWSKIIYLDVEWFEKYASQRGCETDEERERLRDEVVDEIKSFLTDRHNNGKTVVGDKMPTPDGGKSIYSFEVVDVPQPTSKASLEDLEKVTSAIFFSMGVHPALVGAVPGSQGKSSSGTQQRELTLLKMLQLSPKQRQVISVFEFIRDWNNLDTHLTFGIKKYVLSTLDRSNTGLVEESE